MKIAALVAIIQMFFPADSQSREIESVESEKVYVELSQVAFVKHEMAVCIGGEWIPINAFIQMLMVYILEA